MTGKPARSGTVTTTPAQLNRVVASARGNWFATGGYTSAQVWNSAAGSANSVVLDHRNRVVDFAFSPDGPTLLTVSWDQTARLWSLPEGRALDSPLTHLGMVEHGTFSGDQLYLATARFDGQILIWKRPAP